MAVPHAAARRAARRLAHGDRPGGGVLTGLAASSLSRAQERLLSARADATATNVEQWVQERQDSVVRLAGLVAPLMEQPVELESNLRRTAQARDLFDVLFVAGRFGAESDSPTLLAQRALDPRAPVATTGTLAALEGDVGAARYRNSVAAVAAAAGA